MSSTRTFCHRSRRIFRENLESGCQKQEIGAFVGEQQEMVGVPVNSTPDAMIKYPPLLLSKSKTANDSYSAATPQHHGEEVSNLLYAFYSEQNIRAQRVLIFLLKFQ